MQSEVTPFFRFSREEAKERVKEWLKETFQSGRGSVARDEVFTRYLQFCWAIQAETTSRSGLGRLIKQVFPEVGQRRLGPKKGNKTYYDGMVICPPSPVRLPVQVEPTPAISPPSSPGSTPHPDLPASSPTRTGPEEVCELARGFAPVPHGAVIVQTLYTELPVPILQQSAIPIQYPSFMEASRPILELLERAEAVVSPVLKPLHEFVGRLLAGGDVGDLDAVYASVLRAAASPGVDQDEKAHALYVLAWTVMLLHQQGEAHVNILLEECLRGGVATRVAAPAQLLHFFINVPSPIMFSADDHHKLTELVFQSDHSQQSGTRRAIGEILYLACSLLHSNIPQWRTHFASCLIEELARSPAQLTAMGLYELECRGVLQLVINVLHQTDGAALYRLLPTLMGKLSPFRGLQARLALSISHLEAQLTSRLTLDHLEELLSSEEECPLGSSSFDEASSSTVTPILSPLPYYSPLSVHEAP